MQKISRKALWQGLALTVGVSIVSLLGLFAFTASGEVLSALSKVSPLYLLYGMLSIFAVWTVQALRIEVLARSFGQGVGMRYALKVYLTSSFVAHVTPFSSGGIPVEIYLLYRRGISVARSSAIILVQGSLTALVLLLSAPILIYFWGQHMEYASGANWGFVLVLALVVALSYILVRPDATRVVLSRLLLQGPVGRVLGRGARRDKTEGLIERVYSSVHQFSESIAHLWREQKGVLFLSLLLTVLYWMCYLSVVPIVLRGLGLRVGVVSAIIPQLIFNLFQAFIPTPGGSGGAELGFASMYAAMVPKSSLATFILMWRFLTFYLSLFVGGVIALSVVRDLGADDASEVFGD